MSKPKFERHVGQILRFKGGLSTKMRVIGNENEDYISVIITQAKPDATHKVGDRVEAYRRNLTNKDL